MGTTLLKERTSARRSLSERIAVRFGATFLTNLLRAGLSFASGVLIARGLGASRYGDFHFLLGSFVAVSQLMAMGTSSAFFTFISRRPRGMRFFILYGGWMAFQFVVSVLLVGLILPGSVIEWIWLGQERGIVLLAFSTTFLISQLWGMMSQLGEASRKTVVVQVAAAIQAIVHLTLVAVATYWGWLTIATVMWLLVGEHTILAAIFARKLLRENLADEPDVSDGYRTVVNEFTAYCKPLVIYTWIGFLYSFADRWLLQQFGGGTQQGFFAIGQQFANIGLIATTSILKIFWKETAEAQERQDHQRVKRLYLSASRGLHFSVAFITCLFIPYAHEILNWTVGQDYEAASLTLQLMLIYVIYQSLGQIKGTFFYATGQLGYYTKINMLMMGVSIPVTYLILASPATIVPGFNLGAVGLAAKTVALAVIGVNLQAYVIARLNDWSHDYGHQGIVVLMFLSLGWLCRWVSTGLFGLTVSNGDFIWVMLLGSGLYLGASLTVLYCWPALGGLTRAEIVRGMSGTARWLRLTVT